MPEALVEARGVSKIYRVGKPRRHRVTALDGVELAVRAGETVGVVGPSGAGKSVLGRIMAGIEEPTDGLVAYRGRPLSEMSRRERAALRPRMQVLFQDPQGALNPLKIVGRSMREIGGLIGARRTGIEAIVDRQFASVGLSPDVLHRFPRELSGGQNQRVALARILMLGPELIVLDEPTSGLDVSVQAQILRLLRSIQEESGIAYLFISHDEEVVRFMCHRVLALERGKIVAGGSSRTAL